MKTTYVVAMVAKLPWQPQGYDSPYFRCPDEERFYPFEILALRTLKLQLFRVVVFAFNKFYFSP